MVGGMRASRLFEREQRVTEAMAQGAWAFAGRESELRAIAGIRKAEEVRCVVLAGAAGVGKTRLAREALKAAAAAGRPTCWAAGTRAASAIPLGAMAHLVPAADPGSSPLALLQHAMSALRENGFANRLVIGIDDAHLLDEMSATLVHQLALSGTVAMVLTVRSGESRPDPVSALWKDGLAARLELKPLGRAELDGLVTEALEGPVDTRTMQLLWRLTGGNPLFLRELVDLGRDTGSLRRCAGVWHWEGGVTPTPRLAEIVRAQLGKLSPDERAVLELLATAGPVDVELLDGAATRDAVAGLERRRLVQVERDGRHAEASVAQPLHAEVVRAQVPEGTARRMCRELVAAGAHAEGRDVLRAGRLLLDSDEPEIDADLLTAAAARANSLLAHGLAERLAVAAVDGGVGLAATLELLEAVHWQGRAVEAERIAAAAAALVRSDDEVARLAILRAGNLSCGLRRNLDAEAVLLEAEAAVTTDAARARLVGSRGLLAFRTARPTQAIELGRLAMTMGDADQGARECGCAALAGALAVTGRFDDGLAAAATGWSVIESHPAGTGTTFARLALAHGELLALRLAGRIHELQARAYELHRRSTTHPEWAGDAVAAMHMGWTALASGRPYTAVRWLTEACAGLARHDPAGLAPLCRSQLAAAYALLGDTGAAGALLTELQVEPPAHRVFEPEILLAQAWYAAADERLSEAARLALRAAAVAAETGQRAVEAQALHTVARLGRPSSVAGRLRTLTAYVDGPLVAVYAEHAEAQAAGAGGRLDAVAVEFEQLGAPLLAADAAAHAAAAHARDGDRRRAAASTAKAAELARECEEARTPALEQLALPRLTRREVEIANLAKLGLHNQAIADKLVLSIRTVEAHLANTYTKLGIKSRKQLREALGLSTPGSRTGAPVIPRPRMPMVEFGAERAQLGRRSG